MNKLNLLKNREMCITLIIMCLQLSNIITSPNNSFLVFKQKETMNFLQVNFWREGKHLFVKDELQRIIIVSKLYDKLLMS